MKYHKTLLPFLFIAVFILGILQITNILGFGPFIEKMTAPISGQLYTSFLKLNGSLQALAATEKKLDLVSDTITIQKLQDENKALRDQFETSEPRTNTLVPGRIIGAPSFIPGVTPFDTFVIDVGGKNGVQVGQAVVYKNNLIGKITKTTNMLSEVSLISKNEFHISAKISNSNTRGVVNGRNNEVLLENVLLSETIKEGDYVITAGDTDIKGGAIPADLVIGQITSIDKKPSALFQSAKIKSFVDVSKLPIVFVSL